MTELRFRQFETTADTGLIIWGRNEERLLENAAAGLFHLLAEPRGLRETQRRSVTAGGDDGPARLVAWLSEWLYLFDTEGFIGLSFGVEKSSHGAMCGWGRGDRYDPARHVLRCGVKGITYHSLQVERAGERLRARVILDV